LRWRDSRWRTSRSKDVGDFLARAVIDEVPLAYCPLDVEEYLDHEDHVHRLAVG
jgi:hypothetical protein